MQGMSITIGIATPTDITGLAHYADDSSPTPPTNALAGPSTSTSVSLIPPSNSSSRVEKHKITLCPVFSLLPYLPLHPTLPGERRNGLAR